MSEIERELEQVLRRVLDPISARPIPARRPVQRRGAFRTVIGGAGAALTLKVLTGVVAAAAAVTVAGAVTTGSFNPAVWGQQVRDRVISCQQAAANSGQHGIGDCVSPFASTHGAAVASAARQHGQGNGNAKDNTGSSNGNGSGSSNSHSKDKSKDHSPAPKTSSIAPVTIDPEPMDTVGGHPPVSVTPGP